MNFQKVYYEKKVFVLSVVVFAVSFYLQMKDRNFIYVPYKSNGTLVLPSACYLDYSGLPSEVLSDLDNYPLAIAIKNDCKEKIEKEKQTAYLEAGIVSIVLSLISITLGSLVFKIFGKRKPSNSSNNGVST